MTFLEFDKLQDSIWKQVKLMSETKGKEYACSADRFANFNRLAEELGIHRNLVWQVYFTKHLDGIRSYIKTGEVYSDEAMLGRIVDAITYLTLLGGMIHEEQDALTNPPYKGTNQ